MRKLPSPVLSPETGSTTIIPQPGDVRDLKNTNAGDAPDYPAIIESISSRLASAESQLAALLAKETPVVESRIAAIESALISWASHLRPSFPHLPDAPKPPADEAKA